MCNHIQSEMSLSRCKIHVLLNFSLHKTHLCHLNNFWVLSSFITLKKLWGKTTRTEIVLNTQTSHKSTYWNNDVLFPTISPAIPNTRSAFITCAKNLRFLVSSMPIILYKTGVFSSSIHFSFFLQCAAAAVLLPNYFHKLLPKSFTLSSSLLHQSTHSTISTPYSHCFTGH